MATIYKICRASEWDEAVRSGAFRGSAIDEGAGCNQFSTTGQVADTARHLVLVAVDADRLGDKLTWEPSRGGALFPHLYAELPVDAALWVKPLPWREGRRVFPADMEG